MNILEDFTHNPLYEQFIDYLHKKYPDEYDVFTPEDIQDKFEIIFNLGLVQVKKFLKINRSCHLLYNGHPARQDMIDRLGNILFELQRISSYPVVPPLRLGAAIKKVVGLDKRYIKKYQDWIITLSNYQPKFNSVDLSVLVSTFPEELIIQRDVVY